MMAMLKSTPIRPYSIAVAPFRSFKSRRKISIRKSFQFGARRRKSKNKVQQPLVEPSLLIMHTAPGVS